VDPHREPGIGNPFHDLQYVIARCSVNLTACRVDELGPRPALVAAAERRHKPREPRNAQPKAGQTQEKESVTHGVTLVRPSDSSGDDRDKSERKTGLKDGQCLNSPVGPRPANLPPILKTRAWQRRRPWMAHPIPRAVEVNSSFAQRALGRRANQILAKANRSLSWVSALASGAFLVMFSRSSGLVVLVLASWLRNPKRRSDSQERDRGKPLDEPFHGRTALVPIVGRRRQPALILPPRISLLDNPSFGTFA